MRVEAVLGLLDHRQRGFLSTPLRDHDHRDQSNRSVRDGFRIEELLDPSLLDPKAPFGPPILEWDSLHIFKFRNEITDAVANGIHDILGTVIWIGDFVEDGAQPLAVGRDRRAKS